MWFVYKIQHMAFSFCVYLFTLFTLLVYYGDVLYSMLREEIQPEYDYIIVGSGTAGSLIAHRLATETHHSFLVLEAGSRSHFLYEIPAAGTALHGSIYDWMFETVPQEFACQAMLEQKCRLTQGKIIGGSAKLNNMVHVRGNISHYFNWFQGKHSLDYITQQFDFIEKHILHVNDLQYESDLANLFLNASVELGYEIIDKEFKKGFSKTKVTQRNGKRFATSDNLDTKHVITNALVDKVLIDNNVATGVEFYIFNKKKFVKANKGVILTAGTYNTPKILQLSGVGPAKLLNKIGVNVVKDLPVGYNLQDHVATGLDLVLFDKYFKIKAEDTVHPYSVFEYFFKGKGPLTIPGCEAIGFVSRKNQSDLDLQFMILPFGLALDRGSHLRKAVGIKDEVWEKYFVKIFDKYTATVMPLVLHPKSKGTVLIQSKNHNIPPLINPRYLTHKHDRKVLIAGLKIVQKLSETNSIKSAGGNLNTIPFPGCEKHKIFSDSYWDCYITHLTFSSYHPVGTCSMGLPGSQNTVVDTSFKVLGLDNLYVADASVLPTLPSGNINAAVAMMASVFFETIIHNENQNNKYDFETIAQVCSKTDLVEVMLRMCTSKY